MRVIVRGNSMNPTFKEGERLFASRLFFRFFAPKEGDIIVLEHPFWHILIVKRVKKITPGGVVVAGDNRQESEDSGAFGPISQKKIIAKVLFRFH